MMTLMGRIKKKYKGLATSLRFEVVDNAFRRYPDGREVTLDNERGQEEYRRRTLLMAERQNWICGRGDHRIMVPTFDHSDTRGMGSARRDDRVSDSDGRPINAASCWYCNCSAGSKRIL
jgi:hypothetical protein